MTIGIYKITNNINQKSYIGKSIRIEERWRYHKNNFNNSQDYNKLLYQAFRKYGIENFSFEILEKCDSNDIEFLNEREQYWIKYYNTFGSNGYNATLGGDGGKTYEQGVFSKEEVCKIRQYYLDCRYTYSEIYEKYYKDRISLRGFRAIWDGQNYKDVMPEVFSEENKRRHIELGRKKEGVKRRRIDLDTIKEIRKKIENGTAMKKIWREEYQEIYSYGGFRDVIKKKHPDEEEDWYDQV